MLAGYSIMSFYGPYQIEVVRGGMYEFEAFLSNSCDIIGRDPDPAGMLTMLEA